MNICKHTDKQNTARNGCAVSGAYLPAEQLASIYIKADDLMTNGQFERIRDLRRQLHACPEISGREERTRALLEAFLRENTSLEICSCGSGFYAAHRESNPVKGGIALRADYDALALPGGGAGHLCGHDGHAAALCALALLLEGQTLGREVFLLFQPAEETAQGAPSMIANGAMEGVDAVYGQHIWTQVPTGKVAFAAGPRMASAGQFEIWVQGKGGHGAEPHNCHDAVTCCAAIVNSLQTIVSREYRPIDAAVCTVGRMDVGTRWNVIADSGYLAGTTRCFDRQVFAEFPERIERIVKGTCEAYRCTYKTKYTTLTTPTVNHPYMADIIDGACKKIYGDDDSYKIAFDPTTGGEDFCFFIDAAPDQMGAIALVGCGCEAKDTFQAHHSPKFKVDEDALLNGACLYCQVAADFLNK